MGRIKTTLVKRTAEKLIKNTNHQFSPDFEENKKILAENQETPSKKIRNKIAGYITRLKKREIKEKGKIQKTKNKDAEIK